MAYICKNENGSTIHKAKLHNPIENFVKTATNVNCQRMNGLVYGFGNSLVYFYVLEKKNSPNTDIKALSSKKKSLMLLQHLSFLSKQKLINVKKSYWSIKKTRKLIKTITKSKLESKRNGVWKFPRKGNWSFNNCSLKPMIRCMLLR